MALGNTRPKRELGIPLSADNGIDNLIGGQVVFQLVGCLQNQRLSGGIKKRGVFYAAIKS